MLVLTSQEWPEEVYPAYANGPGYVISSDIADFIMTEFTKQDLRVKSYKKLFSMSLFFHNFPKYHQNKIYYLL
jgi:hydroxyproline O-galactosyltransferase 2/3/4/5/6